jgi:hypothetical protein
MRVDADFKLLAVAVNPARLGTLRMRSSPLGWTLETVEGLDLTDQPACSDRTVRGSGMLSLRLAASAIYPIGIPFSSVGTDRFQPSFPWSRAFPSALPATGRLVERAVHTDRP